MLDRIVVVGAGRTGESLLTRLATVAPLVVVDTSDDALAAVELGPGAAPLARSAEGSGQHEAAAPAPFPLTKTHADGTSRLVLEDLRGSRQARAALVAATGDDRTNLEVCRLGAELDYAPVVAIAIDPHAAKRYEAFGARTIVRATLLGDVVERALRYDGVAVASSVGLGKGDILEVRVLPSSPYVGTPLAQLRADGWRVAAIYRHGVLVIPTGSTAIAADDRVLLVGDPEILPRVAEDLRAGVPDFPLRFGPNLVTFHPRGLEPHVEADAIALGAKTAHRGVAQVRNEPNDSLVAQLDRLSATRPGVVVSARLGRRFSAWLLGKSGADGELCDRLRVPVWFAGGEPTKRRVVHVVADGLARLRLADVSIDLARMLGASFAVMIVEPPKFFGGAESPLAHTAAGVVKRAELHRVAVDVVQVRGNPIAEVVAKTRPDDLLVVARFAGARDSFSSPDVALRLARKATCATLVLTGDAADKGAVA